ncbi:dienelactone hydrolase family protein [Dyadobacter sp. CY261]|uniref:alpha/beta hydrolase n=1 Tax=Dyadobacter sp. CY261 TaxID=2907203 RepID=UPI001F36EB5E|nr:dienelactone hydrolase family protein [Dyadobacter sp. CY261]MCF0069140.1 dienelactone hydrolase family protein [Dyadobacter sp. CY261]
MYTHSKQFITSGVPIQQAKKAIVMLHGRGGTAADIVSLQKVLKLEDFAIYAPQATDNSWYPYSFMAPVQQNQPALDSALALVGSVVAEIEAEGIAVDQIYFAGFSQGACLTLEYTSRNARKYGGIIAFTGGLIGQELAIGNYNGNFKQAPVFISTGNPDPHVPVSRVQESVTILEDMNAVVNQVIYPGRPHTISGDEIQLVNNTILKRS